MFLWLDDPSSMESELYVWGNFRPEQNRPLFAAYAYETAQAMVPDAANPAVWLLTADAYRAAGRNQGPGRPYGTIASSKARRTKSSP